MQQVCGPIVAAVLADAQALSTHLGTITVPDRLQAANDALKQAIQTTISAFTDWKAAIDAQATARFEALEVSEIEPARAAFGAPIALINAQLPASQALTP